MNTPVVPGGDGCYYEVAAYESNDEALYSQSGTFVGAEIYVYADTLTSTSSEVGVYTGVAERAKRRYPDCC